MEESKAVSEDESQNGHTEGNLMEAAVSSGTHQIELNNRTLTDIRVVGKSATTTEAEGHIYVACFSHQAQL